MNANEISPKANPRLNRIKTVSRLVKWAMFAPFIFTILLCLFFFVPSSPSPFVKTGVWHLLFLILFQIVVCVWYWKLTRLFNFYEQGLIFAAETIRCIKILGALWIIGWMFLTAAHFSSRPPSAPPTTSASTQPMTKVTSHGFVKVGFITFDFGMGIDFGMPLSGAIILVIAWIMDEGRKIQEEQELTV